MKLKSLAKGLLVTGALALTLVAAPVSSVRAAEGTYTVEKDDCLRKIAKKVYGDEELWKIIYDANTGIVKDDYIIHTGQILTIPTINSSTTAAPTTPAPTTPTDPAPTTPVPATPTDPAPATPATTTPTTPDTPAPTTPAQGDEFLLDYNEIASWVTGGFVGVNTTGETVIFGTDAADEYGIIIFNDDSTMTAASFVGAITYGDEYMTITDEANGLALTMSVTEIGDGTLALDMGNLGVATVTAQIKDTVLNYIKMSIDGYTHVA